jgi:hypothetical protein
MHWEHAHPPPGSRPIDRVSRKVWSAFFAGSWLMMPDLTPSTHLIQILGHLHLEFSFLSCYSGFGRHVLSKVMP